MSETRTIKFPPKPIYRYMFDPHGWAVFLMRMGWDHVESFSMTSEHEKLPEGINNKSHKISLSVTLREPPEPKESA